jgi:transcriptional regulator with XRE-family HTH domain
MTQRAVWLGQQLAALRNAAGLTLQQAGDYLGRNPSSVSRFESGEIPARIGDVVALMNLYGVDDSGERDNLERLAREVWQRGWWEQDRYRRNLISQFIDLAWLESRATEIQSYEAMSLPGLLQTRQYAEAAIRAFDSDDQLVLSALEFRLKRQRVLDGEHPPMYRCLLDESTLLRPFVGAPAMREQLAHLLTMSKKDNIELRIVPLAAGAHAGQFGSFSILTQPYPFTQVGYAETLAGSVYVEDVDSFIGVWEQLLSVTIDHQATYRLIEQLERDFG